MADKSVSKNVSVEESTNRQKIAYVKQIIRANLNDYINNPKLKTLSDIDKFANNLVINRMFYMGIRPAELKNIIDSYLDYYSPRGGSKKSRKSKKAKKSKKSKKAKKSKKSRNKRR